MFGYVYFSYLIRIVVFFNRYRSVDCCTVLSGKVFLQFFVVVTYFVVLSVVFFIPCGRTCSTTWMCVPSPGC